jgi:hypothetical protein
MKRSVPTLLTIFLVSIVSAGPVEGVEQLLSGLGQIIIILIQFLSNTILDINSFDEFLFAKILLFTIILLAVYTVVKKNSMFGSAKPIHWIIATSIAILSIRFIPDNFIQAILLQYSVLGIGLTTFLPFAIFLFFIHQSGFGPWGRKMGWIFYGATFLSMWLFRYQDLGEANYIYWIGIGMILISFLFDKYIHEQFGLSEWRKVRANMKDGARIKAMDDLEKLEDAYNKGYYSGRETQYKNKKKHLEEVIRKNI